MRAEEFPVDLLVLNLEDYDIFQDKLGDGEKRQSLLPLTLTSSLTSLSDEELLMPLSPFHECEMPPSPASPSLYSACTTPISTPVGSRCVTPNWSTPCSTHGSHMSTPGSSFANTPSPSHSSSPRSSGFPSPSTSSCDTQQPLKIPRHKRKSHIRAEHKRRNKIQNGFDVAKSLVPALAESPNASKDTKSVVLKKTADYVRQLRDEKKDLTKQTDALQEEIRSLTADIRLQLQFLGRRRPTFRLPLPTL